MGEYVSLNGRKIKLGTCEDLFYARFDQLREVVASLKKVDGNDEPFGYLNPLNGYRYRFPFPDEDQVRMGEYLNHSRGLTVGVPSDFLDGVEHTRVTFMTENEADLAASIFLPCPLSEDSKKYVIRLPHFVPLEIVQQKQVDGCLWTVCRCGWCGALFRIDRETAVRLADHIRLMCYQPSKEYWVKVADRILEGYNSGHY